MTESRETEQQTEKSDVHSFGERLYAARTRQGLSAADVAKAVNLTVEIIEAIERSDVEHLPQPAFVQGYIRVYARQIGVPEDIVLDEYSRAVPHLRESVLRPRSVLPDETNSGSPFIKIISAILLIAIVLAAVYGIVSYYSEMADMLAPELDGADSASLELPYMEYPVEETEMLSPDNEVSSADNEESGSYNVEQVVVEKIATEAIATDVEPPITEKSEADMAERAAGPDTERAAIIETRQVAPGDDVLTFEANEPSWVEVVDANGIRLQYDLIQNGRTVTLRGTAPFNIFLGNAPAMTVRVNDVQIDMTKYVRSNNIAHFKVSVPDGQVKFH